MEPLTYFGIPSVLLMRGIKLHGAANGWKLSETSSISIEINEISDLLKALQPLLLDLVLSGWEVESFVLCTQPNLVAQSLRIDLSNLQYTLRSWMTTAASAWEEETGVPWLLSGSDESPASGIFVPPETTAALGVWLRMRDNYHLNIDSDTYAIPLAITSESAFLADDPNDSRRKCLVMHTDSLPPDEGSGDFSIAFVIETLAASQEFGTISNDVREEVRSRLGERWLSVDRQPAGIINHLCPDVIIAPYKRPKFGTLPQVWGTCVPYPLVLNAKPHEYSIWSYCRRVWEALLQVSYDFEDIYEAICDTPFKTLLNDGTDHILLGTLIDLRTRWEDFSQQIREAYLERYFPFGDIGTLADMTLKNIAALGSLSWAQIMLYLHEIQIVDLLTGVTVKPPAAGETLPTPEYRSHTDSGGPDFTGFYYQIGGTRTLQINQAGEEGGIDYWHGYMAERLESTYGFYTLVLFELLALPSSEQEEVEGIFKLVGEDGAEYVVRTYQPEWQGGELLLNLTIVDHGVWRFQRERADSHLPDDTIYSEDTALQEQLSIAQRHPFHPTERGYLEEVSGHLFETIAHYSYYNSASEASFHYQQIYNTSQCNIRRFVDLTSTTSQPIANVNAQFPAVQRYLRECLMTTPYEGSWVIVPPDVTAWEALLFILRHKQTQGTPIFPETILDNFVIALLGITDEEIQNVERLRGRSEATEGEFVYLWRTQTLGASASEGIVGAGGAGVLFEVKSSPKNIKLGEQPWHAVYVGTAVSGSVSIGPAVTAGATKSTWSDISAPQAWTSSDFAGPAKLWAVTVSAVIGGGMTFSDVGQVAFFSDKGVLIGSNTGTAEAYGLLLGVEAAATEMNVVLVYHIYGDNSNYTPLTIAQRFMAQVVANRRTHFDSSSHELRPEGKTDLRRMVAEFRALLERPTSTLEIDGFTDPQGSAGYNMGLAYRRAQSVYNFIHALLGQHLKIPTSQTIVRSFGEYSAIYVGKIEDGQESQEWRRVEVRINGALVGTFYAGMIQSQGS